MVLEGILCYSGFHGSQFAEEIEDRFHVKRSDYYAALAEELITYVDNTGGENTVLEDLPSVPLTNDHNPIPAPHKERM